MGGGAKNHLRTKYFLTTSGYAKYEYILLPLYVHKTRSQILVSLQCRFCVKNLEVTILVLDTWIIAYMTAYILSFQKMYTCHGVGETEILEKRSWSWKNDQKRPKMSHFLGKMRFLTKIWWKILKDSITVGKSGHLSKK